SITEPLIALMTGDFHEKAADEIRGNVIAVAERLANAGARIDRSGPPTSFEKLGQAFWIILTTEAAGYHHEGLENRPDSFDPKTLEFLRRGSETSAIKYLHSLEAQRRFRHDVAAILRPYDAILVPSTNFAAPAGLDSTGDPVFNNPWSMSGNPVVG